jgi:hypothetical protein
MRRMVTLIVALLLVTAFTVTPRGFLGGSVALAANGTQVGSVTFDQSCGQKQFGPSGNSGLSVGITYDGTYLWFSCYDTDGTHGSDLFRATVLGHVTASYDIVPSGGLGALAYDATRNVIWAGGGGGSGSSNVYKITLDSAHSVTGSAVAFDAGPSTNIGSCGLDDGIGFDANHLLTPADDVLYYSPDCLQNTTITIFKLNGTVVGSIPWAGSGANCYNSGVAIGGSLLYEGSDGCSHVWVVNKSDNSAAFDFSTNGLRDEGLTCDTNTFKPVDVMWSKEAFEPNRATAFEIPHGTCGVGGVPASTLVYTGPGSQDYHDSVTLSATIVDANGNPVTGDPTHDFITFTLGTQSCVGSPTDASGTSSCSITLNQIPGNGYTVVASFAGDDSHGATSASAPFTITREETSLAYTGATSGDFNDPATFSATLTEDGITPISGATLTFSLAAQTCTGVAPTDASGSAACSITPSESAGSYPAGAAFAGDAFYLASSTSFLFTVALEQDTLTSTSSLMVFAQGQSATLTSVLLEDGITPIVGRSVTMTLGSGVGAQSCVGITDASGTATCTISPVTVGLGPQSVTDSFTSDGFYQSATNGQQALVFAFPASGDFVLGDRTVAAATPTTTVTYWGAQWAQLNSLSSGPAPNSFKGFANLTTPAPPACTLTASWSTTPGNSPPPPTSVPSYLGVIVASTASQSGNTISGNVVQIVVVKTNPGYSNNPGHPGTGTIVATYC